MHAASHTPGLHRTAPCRRQAFSRRTAGLRAVPVRCVAPSPPASSTSTSTSSAAAKSGSNGNGNGLPAPQQRSDGSSPAVVERRGGNGRPARLAFLDEDGQVIRPMPADYGFRSGSARLYQQDYGTIPKNVLELSVENFKRELRALRRAVRFNELDAVEGEGGQAMAGPLYRLGFAAARGIFGAFAKLDVWLEQKNVFNEITEAPRTQMEGELNEEQKKVLAQVRSLTLDDSRVAARERARRAVEARPAPLPIRAAYVSLCWALDVLYAGRPVQRFWILETVARMPYFVWISMLHLYESLGWWRAGAELRKVHFAEEWNELHHLQIMEALGGDLKWVDRFVAEHAAVFYYWVLIVIYLISPSRSYQFMEMVEGHAADTYAEFAEQNRELLQQIPPPLVALNYYKSGDLYLFDEFQTSWKASGELRRPSCNNLYDVFINIRDDELEHVKTMEACQDGSIALDLQNGERMAQIASNENVACIAPWEEAGQGSQACQEHPPAQLPSQKE